MQLLLEFVNCSNFCIAVMYSLGVILIMGLDGSMFADLTQLSCLKSTESISLLGRLESTLTLFSLAITGVRGGGGDSVHIVSLLAHKNPMVDSIYKVSKNPLLLQVVKRNQPPLETRQSNGIHSPRRSGHAIEVHADGRHLGARI